VIVEAWAPTRVACLEEVGRGLVDTFADVSGVRAEGSHPISIAAMDDEESVVTLLDEIVYLLDAEGVVPVEIELEAGQAGAITGRFLTAPVGRIVTVGAPPKGVSRSDLFIGRERGWWVCRIEIDV
jgi:SHS2 domain-containing protein